MMEFFLHSYDLIELRFISRNFETIITSSDLDVQRIDLPCILT
jgi:hypothetical protein